MLASVVTTDGGEVAPAGGEGECVNTSTAIGLDSASGSHSLEGIKVQTKRADV